MVKEFAKFMRYGKLVESLYTGNIFKLIEDMDENKEMVKAVAVDDYRRYELLGAWLNNWQKDEKFRERFTGNIEECAVEREGYVVELRINSVKPANKVRFITPNYDTKFEVDDLGMVRVDGKLKRVYHIDDYHFGFVEGGAFGAFHIYQYAELCERNGIVVQPSAKK